MVAPENPHILVVDDDRRLRQLLQRYLVTNGCRVQTLDGGGNVRSVLSLLQVDLIILDIMMPGEDGLSLARWIRTAHNTPIILLTAVSEIDHKMTGFGIGIDDYMTKPFEPQELLARIHAILRRRVPDQTSQSGDAVHHFGDYRYDPQSGHVSYAPQALSLSATEERLLVLLGARAGTPLSRDFLAREVAHDADIRTIDVHVSRLRKKIEKNPKRPKYLKTIRGHGYVLEPDS